MRTFSMVSVVLFAIILIVIVAFQIVLGIQFNQNCEGYLKRAADANTISMAEKELEIALEYIEKNKLTKGYTSVLYNTPDEDVGFWYNNLKESMKELQQITPEATQLEQSNVLMKLRETLLDSTDSGTSVTCPSGISLFPHNDTWAWFSWFCLAMIIMFGFAWWRSENNY